MAVTSPAARRSDPPRHVRTPALRFLSSLAVDERLAKHDIAGSVAHVEMLGTTGILPKEDARVLAQGLRQLHREVASGSFAWREDLEDVHTNVEVRLTEIVGPVGRKVHTARSRNDQIALDERLWLREAIHAVQSDLLALQDHLLALAEAHVETPLPGYTHLQRAQPVTLGHHLLAHHWRFSRDFERLSEAFARANVSPLGSGALAGSTLPIDPAAVARRLGFASAFENSLDAVSDRDPLAEFLFALSLLAVHLSALGEELVFWSSTEVGFLRPTPELGSGSSLMPQKRNPDVAELVRGKSGRVIGDLVALLTTLKGLPLAYNRDLQEDKAPAFDAAGQIIESLQALNAAIPSLDFDTVRMTAAASDPRLYATDLAEYLVNRGVAFREAHEVVARYLSEHAEITAESLRAYDARFQADVAAVLDPATAVSRRASPGGPSPAAVRPQLAHAKDRLGLERYQLSRHAESVQLLDAILSEESE